MAYEYVKQHYDVNPVVGGRVRMLPPNKPKEGVIVGKRCYDCYVHVRFDGRTFDVPVHPLDLEYL